MTLRQLSRLLDTNPFRFRFNLWTALHGDKPYDPSWCPDINVRELRDVEEAIRRRGLGIRYQTMLEALLGLEEGGKVPGDTEKRVYAVAASAALEEGK